MKSKNKPIIDVYPTIYNVDLVVVNKYVTIEKLNKIYETVEHTDIVDDECITYTQIGYNKKTNQPVIIVRYCKDSKSTTTDKKLDLINTCAHEALHVCMDIYTKIGEKVFE